VKRRVLVDTGPLVAILSSADQHHAACVKALHQLPGPLFSCWPVITEAVWLLRSHPPAVQQLLRSCFSEKPAGFLELLPLAGAEAGAIADVMKDYQDIRPQLADAALVYLAARESIDTIFTLDRRILGRRDFGVYRSAHKRAFRIVP
jgi:predicted nucleic acid-binding protein